MALYGYRVKTIAAGLAAMAVLAGCTNSAPREGSSVANMPWGPAASTPGVSLKFVETGRHVVKPGETASFENGVGKTEVDYKLKATGLQPGADYDLWLRPAFQEPVRTGHVVRVDASGYVTERGRPAVFEAGNYLKGEPFSAGLISPDGAVRAIALVYPFPLRAVDGPCRLTLEILTKDGRTFGAIGQGFAPGSTVETISRSDGEVHKSQRTVGSDGRLSTILFPATIGGGQHASFAIHAKTCSVKVNYDWGRAALVPQ